MESMVLMFFAILALAGVSAWYRRLLRIPLSFSEPGGLSRSAQRVGRAYQLMALAILGVLLLALLFESLKTVWTFQI